jgi:hypothetical protein
VFALLASKLNALSAWYDPRSVTWARELLRSTSLLVGHLAHEIISPSRPFSSPSPASAYLPSSAKWSKEARRWAVADVFRLGLSNSPSTTCHRVRSVFKQVRDVLGYEEDDDRINWCGYRHDTASFALAAAILDENRVFRELDVELEATRGFPWRRVALHALYLAFCRHAGVSEL